MKTLAKEASAEFLFESDVTEAIEKNNHCVGIKYRDKYSVIQEIKGKTILDCMGHQDPLGISFGIKREEIDCPTIKYSSSNALNVKLSEYPYPQ